MSALAELACGGLAQGDTASGEAGRRDVPPAALGPQRQRDGSRGGSGNGPRVAPPPLPASPREMAPSTPVPMDPPAIPERPPLPGGFTPGQSEPAQCDLGEARCAEAGIEVCSPGTSSWELVLLCPCGCRLIEGRPACTDDRCPLRDCADGETRCNGDRLEICAPDGLGFELVSQCASPCLCEVSDANGGRCIPPSCAAGEAMCDSNGSLHRCNACLTGYDLFECAVGEVCDAAQQRCVASAPAAADAGAMLP